MKVYKFARAFERRFEADEDQKEEHGSIKGRKKLPTAVRRIKAVFETLGRTPRGLILINIYDPRALVYVYGVIRASPDLDSPPHNLPGQMLNLGWLLHFSPNRTPYPV